VIRLYGARHQHIAALLLPRLFNRLGGKSGFERHRLQRWPGQIARQQVTQRIRKARRIAISAVEAREHNRNAGLRVMLRRR
jgi:hypothetical protein